ncbi:MAG: DUF4145 domain-containing protein [Myxococcota bacterium]
MEVAATHSQVREYGDEEYLSHSAGPVYETLKCPACFGVTLWTYHYHDAFPEEIERTVLYPQPRTGIAGLPRSIDAAYKAAIRARSADPNAYGVLLGRVVERICADRGAKGKSLDYRLRDLAKRGEIPDRLVSVARRLRQLRNVGAHADRGELTSAELPLMDDLCRALLEYVYGAPLLVKKAEKSLERLRSRRKKTATKKKPAKKKATRKVSTRKAP